MPLLAHFWKMPPFMTTFVFYLSTESISTRVSIQVNGVEVNSASPLPARGANVGYSGVDLSETLLQQA